MAMLVVLVEMCGCAVVQNELGSVGGPCALEGNVLAFVDLDLSFDLTSTSNVFYLHVDHVTKWITALMNLTGYSPCI